MIAPAELTQNQRARVERVSVIVNRARRTRRATCELCGRHMDRPRTRTFDDRLWVCDDCRAEHYRDNNTP